MRALTASGSGRAFSLASSLIMPSAAATTYAFCARTSGRTTAATNSAALAVKPRPRTRSFTVLIPTEMVDDHFRHDAPLAHDSGRGDGGEGRALLIVIHWCKAQIISVSVMSTSTPPVAKLDRSPAVA